ncbi:hypothetical protein [Thalassospira povalilytica]|uniref:hypothetical protein n=1 Tax=Thalassospira povalilytica TaxID=732237 RepID=UPI001D198699|nr:hypothetical protein [Thalassospira povalilytica]MCC4241915.1 hypothetical protein [Thalassospira povalilytica]
MYLIITLLAAAMSAAVASYFFVASDVYLVSPRYISIYLGFPAAIFAIAIAGCLFKSIREYVAITLITVAVSLAGFELFLFWQAPPYNKIQARRSNIEYHATLAGRSVDPRNTSEVIKDLRASGKDAWPTFSPTTFLLNGMTDGISIGGEQTLPLTNVANTRSVYCNESGQWLVFESDQFGFNNLPTYRTQDSRPKAALVGDSFAQGACVSPTSSAQARLNELNIFTQSFGVGGTGPLIQLGLLKEYVSRQKPENVYWFFYEGNDMHTNLAIEEKNEKLLAYLAPGSTNNLVDQQTDIDQALRDFISERMDDLESSETELKSPDFSLRETAKLIRLRTALKLVGCPTRNQNFELLRDVLFEAKRTVSSWGGQLQLVYLPAWDPSCDLFTPSAPLEDSWMHDEVAGIAAAGSIPLIDVKAKQYELGSPENFYWYPGSHFNDAGYDLVAQMISATIEP